MNGFPEVRVHRERLKDLNNPGVSKEASFQLLSKRCQRRRLGRRPLFFLLAFNSPDNNNRNDHYYVENSNGEQHLHGYVVVYVQDGADAEVVAELIELLTSNPKLLNLGLPGDDFNVARPIFF